MLDTSRRMVLTLAASSAFSPSAKPDHRAPVYPLSPQQMNGRPLPLATFGVQIYDDATAYSCTMRALEAGFRSLFTSPEAGNQRGFARAVRDSGVPREELYIIGSVLSDDADTFDGAKTLTTRACAASLEDLAAGGVSGLDLLLLERPAPAGCSAIQGQWRALESQLDAGVCAGLGTCNFDVDQLDCLVSGTRGYKVRHAPLVNQIGFNLATRMPHALLRDQHAARGVALQAWGPLGGPSGLIPRSILDECASIGKPHRKSASQVALQWLVQQRVGFVVHSKNSKHLHEDLAIFDESGMSTFSLSGEEMARLERDSEQAPAYY